MFAQEIFNKVVDHLLTQRHQAVKFHDNGDQSCAYRGDGGTMCAVGCLIPDALYHPDMEIVDPESPWDGTGVSALVRRYPHLAKYVLPSDLERSVALEMMADLQRMHDTYCFAEWPYQMRNIAFYHGLDAACVPFN